MKITFACHLHEGLPASANLMLGCLKAKETKSAAFFALAKQHMASINTCACMHT